MARPQTMDLDLLRGDTYAVDLAMWEDEAKTRPLDMTNIVTAAQIRTAPGSSHVMNLTCTNLPPEVEGDPTNLVRVFLPADEWVDYPTNPGSGQGWDVQLTWTDGYVLTVLSGKVTVVGDYTRAAVA